MTALHRSFPLEGELSSVKISRDSRYALVNRTQNVSLAIEIPVYHAHYFRFSTGNILVRSPFRTTGTQICRATSGQTRHPQLLWRYRWQFCSERKRRCVARPRLILIDVALIFSFRKDGNVYVWQCDTGLLLETLPGHGEGSVNSVAWNPTNERMFATCSDDHTIRIWEAPLREPGSRVTNRSNSNGKGKTRQQSNGDSVDFDSAFGAWVDG
jgi:WD repeat-containing protein 26